MIRRQDQIVRYRYEDFILKLRSAEEKIKNEYVVKAQAPNGIQRERPLVLPQWTEPPSIIYSSQEQDKARVRQFGSQLFHALFRGPILTLYRQSLKDIERSRGGVSPSHLKGLRILLDLQDAANLIHIPWEFLYDDAETDQFLCLDPQTPVVRRLHRGARFSQVEPSLECFLLSAAAPPEAQQRLHMAEKEIKEIQEILRDSRIEVKGHFPSAEADELLGTMKEGYHIVHFTGHGLEDQLVFGDRHLSDEQIRSISTTNPALRLVVINACLAGQKVAEALARSGIPAIIGFQFDVPDGIGRVFAQEFYKNLAAGCPLEVSLHRGRVAMLTELPDSEWAGPVLYLQSASSEEVLGDTLPADKEKEAEPDLTPPDAKERLFHFLLKQGKELSEQGDYQEALAFLEGADGLWEAKFGVAKLDIGKDIRRCQTELEEKRHKSQNKLSKTVLFDKAQNYANEQPPDWDNAFNLLQTIGQLEELEELHRSRARRVLDRPTLKLPGDLNELYQRVRDARNIDYDCRKRRIRLEALYHQGEEGWRTQDWDQAISFFEGATEEVNAIKNRGVSVDERYEDAEARAKEAHNQKELHQLYQRGISLLEQEQWREAVNVFEQLEERAPWYPSLDERLTEAHRERDAKVAYDRGIRAIQNGDWQFAISDLQTIQAGVRCYREAYLALQYAQGCLYMEQGEWLQAVEALANVVSRPSGFEGDARRRYEEALFRRDLKARYQEGRRRMEEPPDWQAAKADLEWVERQQQKHGITIYSDVDQLLDRIEEGRFLEKEYQQAQNFFDTQNWEQAIFHLQAILSKDDKYRDARDLLKQAQAELAHQRGVEGNLCSDWPAAVQAFEEALRLQPDHDEARKGLETARRNLNLEDNYQKGITAYRQGVTIDGVVDVAALEEAIQHLEQVVQPGEKFQDAADKLKESRRLLEAEQNYQAAVQAEEEQNWPQAVKSWQQVVDLARELNCDYRDAASRLRLAIRQKELAEFYRQAQTHQANQNWAEAVVVLNDLMARAKDYGLAPYKDAQTQLKEAKRQDRIAQCFDDGLFYMKTECWKDAITLFNEVIRLDPEHGPAIMQRDEAERQLQLQTDYEDGLEASRSGDWTKAIEHLNRVDSTYKDAATHLEMAKHRQALDEKFRQGLEYADKEEWDQAFACFDEVKRGDPDYLDVQVWWHRAYEYKEINQLYQEACRLDAAARRLKKEGKFEEATNTFDKAIRYYDEVERRRQNVQQS